MKVLVTGGAGFIGSSVVMELLNQGHKVTVFDDLSKGYEEYVDERAEFIKSSLADKEAIEQALEGKDAVIHLAAESIIAHSIENPEQHLKRNINYVIHLLEGMRKQNVKKLVFSSSAAVYGEPKEENPVKENSEKNPLQPYGASKLAVEDLLKGYYNCFGINSVALRYFNVYGPRDDQLPVTRAVPNWIKGILTGKPIKLNWKGKQIRDYIYVEDVAKAHVSVLNLDGYKQYNIGSGKGNSMLEILEAVFNACGKKTKVIDAGERKGDPNYLVSDTTKIKKEVGWEPQIRLEEGMKKTLKFYKNHPESLKRI